MSQTVQKTRIVLASCACGDCNEGVGEGELRMEGESLALANDCTTVEEHSRNTLLTTDPCLTINIDRD